MKYNRLGKTDITLCSVGLGGWPFGGGYDWGALESASALRAIDGAIESGVNWIDTAPVYGDGESERLIGRALHTRRKTVLLASKCGLIKNGSWTDHDLRPASIRRQLEGSLSRLKTDYLDIYFIHYPDPHVPLEDAVGELARLQQEGKTRAIGLCNVSAEELNRAAAVAPVACVQNEYSLLHPQKGENIFAACREKHIGFIGYGTLCGGILSGKYQTAPNLRRADARNYFYKCYRGAAFEQAQQVVQRVRRVAREKGCAPSAVAVAWALQKNEVTSVLCGARTPQQVAQNIQGAQVVLTAKELAVLEEKI